MLDLSRCIPSELLQLQSSKFDFFLTGSRFWGNAGVFSDWDVFTQHSEEVRQFLFDLGFARYFNQSCYTDDTNCIEVFAKYEGKPSQQIHIQLVKDVELKQAVQAFLYSNHPQGLGDKAAARELWKFAFRALEAGRQIASPV